MKKKIVALLTVLILFTNVMTVYGEESNYKDTKTTDWFYSSLDTLSQNNIITGFEDGTFRPDNILNVDQYITILCRLTDNDVGVASSGYWAQNYIDFATENGWLDDMTFSSYSKPINRNEASRLTVKAMEYDSSKPSNELLAYTVYIDDYYEIPSEYRNDVLLNYAIGLTNGYPDGTFQGENTLTRAEAAVISHRVYEPEVRKLLLSPSKTKKLLEVFEMEELDEFALLEPEVTMPNNMMMFAFPAFPAPVPMTAIPLPPPVAVVTENVLADALIEMSDLESDNILAAGYSYGLFNINLLSEENESILIYTATDGSNIITIDLLLMQDGEGNLRPDASDLILLVCKNINEVQGEYMHAFIMTEYENREMIPPEGKNATFGETDMVMKNFTHDHNVTKVEITVD